MKYLSLFILAVCFSTISYAQIIGSVKSSGGKALPFVNIYIENTFIGTTSNEDGNYELYITTPKKYTVVFKYLGYKTITKSVTIDGFPFTLDAVLTEEDISLDEVIIKSNENPANTIIRNAIATRTINLEKIKAYKANFYSRGLLKLKDVPKKILGQEIGDLDGNLDSTRSGIVYLSETISKIEYLYPDKLKEKIIASKVSGDDNGFSFNNARDNNFNFYNNTIAIGSQLVSPIAEYAFNYYRYKLVGVFYDEKGHLINKIQVIPRRINDRVFGGNIYIVEDNWSIYALELSVTGEQAQLPAAEIMTLKQSFSFSEKDSIWALISQSIDFSFSFLKIKGNGRFTVNYSDYEFNPNLSNKDFSREILSFEDKANKKDSTYWETKRPVPLTAEEFNDYIKKDSIQLVRKSKKYLDSIDKKNNKFNVFDLILGYSYQNSHKNTRFEFSGPLRAMSFNTVQGPNARANFNFRKSYDEFNRYLDISSSINYSVSDRIFRPTVTGIYKFNNKSRPILSLSGGNKVEQFNNDNPIHITVNSIGSLFFEDNYMKLYARTFGEVSYSQEVLNGLRLYSSLGFEKRKPMYNTSSNLFIDDENDEYTSNNPLDETAFGIAPFENHNIFKANFSARIRFGQNYMSYPDTKVNIRNEKYPTLLLGLENGFASSNKNNNYTQLKARLTQGFNIGNKGNFSYNIKAGSFIDAENISFIDYHHFNGNQSHVGTTTNYINVFNNLPYYSRSTNEPYLEAHAEHNFKGFILGKIPLLNKLNYNLIVGAHALTTQDFKPYQEYTIGIDNIGWGKFRVLRLDYVRSYESGYQSDAFIFGLKFFNIIN